MAAYDIDRTAGDTGTALAINLKSRISAIETAAVDVTGLTVQLYIRQEGSTVNLSEFDGEDVTASFATPTNGQMRHTVTSAQSAQLQGDRAYTAKLSTDDGAGSVIWYPNDTIGGETVKKFISIYVAGNYA